MMLFDKTLSATHAADIYASNPFLPEDVAVALVGTMFTHGEGNDYDYVVLVPDKELAQADFNESGYYYTGAESGDEDGFRTFRKGDANIMLTEDEEFFKNFKVAAEVTKYVQQLLLGNPLKLYGLNKDQRIKIHRIIMNGEEAE